LKTVKIEVVSDTKNDGYYEVFTRIYSGTYDNTLGTCTVHVHENGVAEIYKIQIHRESHRRKHYGTKLWKFVETYILKKYKPNRFTSELDFSNVSAIKFWKNQNFQLLHKESDYGTIIKETNY